MAHSIAEVTDNPWHAWSQRHGHVPEPLPVWQHERHRGCLHGRAAGRLQDRRELFERIDGAMFMRAYMQDWLVADTAEEYVDAAVRLANNHEKREALRVHAR
jgi:hypothetical protein